MRRVHCKPADMTTATRCPQNAENQSAVEQNFDKQSCSNNHLRTGARQGTPRAVRPEACDGCVPTSGTSIMLAKWWTTAVYRTRRANVCVHRVYKQQDTRTHTQTERERESDVMRDVTEWLTSRMTSSSASRRRENTLAITAGKCCRCRRLSSSHRNCRRSVPRDSVAHYCWYHCCCCCCCCCCRQVIARCAASAAHITCANYYRCTQVERCLSCSSVRNSDSPEVSVKCVSATGCLDMLQWTALYRVVTIHVGLCIITLLKWYDMKLLSSSVIRLDVFAWNVINNW